MRRSEQGIAAEKISKAARERAYRRLAALHPEEFKKLHEEERRADGWTPRPMGRPRVKVDA